MQALALCSQPQHLLTSTCKLSSLIDEIWHVCGDTSTDVSGAHVDTAAAPHALAIPISPAPLPVSCDQLHWYTNRTLLSGVYVSTELYMLTDRSPQYSSTWIFLQRRLQNTEKIAQLPSQAHVGIQYAANVGAMIFERMIKRG
jgi:ubiquinone biosynthesis protein COQ9